MRDSQRSKVYDWERHLPVGDTTAGTIEIQGPYLTRAQVTDLAYTVILEYEGSARSRQTEHASLRTIKLPEIIFRSGIYARGGASRLIFPRWAMTPHVVLHEATHSILLRNQAAGGLIHGSTFVRLFIDLLDRYRVVNRKDSSRLAKERGLRIAKNEGLRPVAKLR